METKQQLQDHLVMLKKKLAELKSKKISISQNRSNKYRQFGDELVNTDTNAAGKFYSMADQLDATNESNKPKEGEIPEDAQTLITMINKKAGHQYNSNMFANASEDKKKRMQAQLIAEVAPLQKELDSLYNGKFSVYGTRLVNPQDSNNTNNPITPTSTTDEAVATGEAWETTDSPGDASSALFASFANAKKGLGYRGSSTANNWLRDAKKGVEMNKRLTSDDKDRLRANIDNLSKELPVNPAAGRMKKAEIALKPIVSHYSKVAAGMSDIYSQLQSLIQKYNNGDYTLANFADLKGTMADGRMTDGDVSIATGLSGVGAMWQGLKSSMSGGNWANAKLADKGTANSAINRIIESYNTSLSMIKNPKFVGDYAKELDVAYKDKSLVSLIQGIDKPFEKLYAGKNEPSTKTVVNNNSNNAGERVLVAGDWYVRNAQGVLIEE